MSKKKSSTTTMSLKDFHGGSIPSDLPLPSAPASSSSAPTRWGPSQIRPDPLHRPRPGSAGSVSSTTSGGAHRLLDERGPPLFSTTNIGRNFDEEERKPFDASSFPRRAPLSDPPPRSSAVPVIGSSRSDPKPQQLQPQVRSAAGANVWGTKKEEVRHVQDLTMESSMAVEDLSARFAQASAIEKVSSGRWQSKRPVTPPATMTQANGEVIRVRETVRVLEEEAKEIRPGSNEGKLSEVKEFGERPRLKLLPRTKVAVDANEVRGFDEKQGYQPNIDHIHMENPRELQSSMNMLRPGSAGENVVSQLSERPRLNLKPRSLPVEQSQESIVRERKSVFGGARPRELVLKERGIDDVVAAHLEVTSPANRNKSDTPKIETKSKLDAPTLASRRAESSEGYSVEQRNVRDFERKEIRSDHGKADAHGGSWRNDNQKNTRETEKPAERRPEPETWRKPLELKPEAPSGPRVGKTASPLELAQAFSRSASDVRINKVQIPFSRLTNTRDFYAGPNPRQINGY